MLNNLYRGGLQLTILAFSVFSFFTFLPSQVEALEDPPRSSINSCKCGNGRFDDYQEYIDHYGEEILGDLYDEDEFEYLAEELEQSWFSCAEAINRIFGSDEYFVSEAVKDFLDEDIDDRDDYEDYRDWGMSGGKFNREKFIEKLMKESDEIDDIDDLSDKKFVEFIYEEVLNRDDVSERETDHWVELFDADDDTEISRATFVKVIYDSYEKFAWDVYENLLNDRSPSEREIASVVAMLKGDYPGHTRTSEAGIIEYLVFKCGYYNYNSPHVPYYDNLMPVPVLLYQYLNISSTYYPEPRDTIYNVVHYPYNYYIYPYNPDYGIHNGCYADFSDISYSPYAYAIHAMECSGVVRGYSSGPYAGQFGPTHSITRAQLATMLVRAFELPIVTNCRQFLDVHANSPHYRDILTLRCMGIAQGYSNGLYGHDDMVTIGQISTLVRKCMERIGTVEPFGYYNNYMPYNDVPMYSPHYNDIGVLGNMYFADQTPILPGFEGGRILYDQPANREYAARTLFGATSYIGQYDDGSYYYKTPGQY